MIGKDARFRHVWIIADPATSGNQEAIEGVSQGQPPHEPRQVAVGPGQEQQVEVMGIRQ